MCETRMCAQLSTVGKALRTLSRQSNEGTSKETSAQGAEELATPMIQNPLRITTSTPHHTLLYMPSRLGR